MRVEVDGDAGEKAKAACVPWLDDDLGERIEQRTRRYAPVNTGALAASVEKHMDDATLVISSWGGDKGRSYAAYNELGHRVYHPSTGIVGPEWVPGVHFMKRALYDEGASSRARMFREDDIFQARKAAAGRERARERGQRYLDRIRAAADAMTPEDLSRARERELREAESAARNEAAYRELGENPEDLRAFTRDRATGEKIYMDERAEENKRREAEWFAEQWVKDHPGESREDAPPF